MDLNQFVEIYKSVPPAYYDWMWERIEREIESPVLEIGSGPGIITRMLLESARRVTGIDVEDQVLERLRQLFESETRLTLVKADATADGLDQLPGAPFSTVVCLNALEHFEDDLAAARNFYRALRPGGRLVVLVPAHPWLFGSMDRMFGHHRRYRKEQLESLLSAAGFNPRVSCFNLVGIPGWWLRFVLFQSASFSPGQNRVYNALIPAMRSLEKHIPPPVGLSLIGVGQKP